MWPTLLLVAGLLAVLLLVVLYARGAQRLTVLRAQVERMQVVQRDMTADVRARLEQGATAWTTVDRDLKPRLDGIEASQAELAATLDAQLPALGEVRSRLATLEERVPELEADLRHAAGGRSEAIDARLDQMAEEVRALRIAHDERVAAVAARVVKLERAGAEASRSPAPATAPAADALAAAEAAADAPATFGASRGRKEPPGRPGRRWLLVAVVLLLGLLGIVVLS
jgi:DNA repair exonuclease SbcCD ATPase subunit